jgi:Tol biopolymer transport system component
MEGLANVFVANPDDFDPVPITDSPKGLADLAMAVSPDGTRVAFSQIKVDPRYYYIENPLGDLFIVKLDGSSKVQLTNTQRKAYRQGIFWLPDNRLMFFGRDEKGGTIFLADPTTGTVTRLKRPSGFPLSRMAVLGLSTDKAAVYWVTGTWCSDRGICDEQYYRTKLDDTENYQVWTGLKNAASSVQISPDGKHIAWDVSLVKGCYVSDIDGYNVYKLQGERTTCDHGSRGGYSWWSPDGSQFIYEAYNQKLDKRYFRVWSYKDGKSMDLPDLQTGACDNLTWMPNGRDVLFFNCQSNTWGTSIPSAARLVSLESGQVTLLAETGLCDLSISPDKQQALFYNCSQNQKDEPLTYKFIGLTDRTINKSLDNITVPYIEDSKYNMDIIFSISLGLSFWSLAP